MSGSPPFWWRPFVAIYLLVFVWPTIQMFGISFTDAPLIGDGDWVGVENYDETAEGSALSHRGLEHRLFRRC